MGTEVLLALSLFLPSLLMLNILLEIPWEPPFCLFYVSWMPAGAPAKGRLWKWKKYAPVEKVPKTDLFWEPGVLIPCLSSLWHWTSTQRAQHPAGCTPLLAVLPGITLIPPAGTGAFSSDLLCLTQMRFSGGILRQRRCLKLNWSLEMVKNQSKRNPQKQELVLLLLQLLLSVGVCQGHN